MDSKAAIIFKNTVALTLIAFFGTFCGDFSRVYYQEYSRYNEYLQAQAARKKAALRSTLDNLGSKDSGVSGAAVDESVLSNSDGPEPPKPNILFMRAFSLIEHPFDMGRGISLYGEKEHKPRPLLYAILGIEWNSGDDYFGRGGDDPDISNLPGTETVLKEFREKSGTDRDGEKDAVKEYLKTKKAALSDEEFEKYMENRRKNGHPSSYDDDASGSRGTPSDNGGAASSGPALDSGLNDPDDKETGSTVAGSGDSGSTGTGAGERSSTTTGGDGFDGKDFGLGL